MKGVRPPAVRSPSVRPLAVLCLLPSGVQSLVYPLSRVLWKSLIFGVCPAAVSEAPTSEALTSVSSRPPASGIHGLVSSVRRPPWRGEAFRRRRLISDLWLLPECQEGPKFEIFQ